MLLSLSKVPLSADPKRVFLLSQHIYLTGYRGTGKTSVGTIVAQSLGWPMIDLDEVVEKEAGRSIRQIFEDGGESLFRELESRALFSVPVTPQVVVSLGGGAILSKENRHWIHHNGTCLWLDSDAETLAERIHGDESTEKRRPALTNLGSLDEIRRLLDERRPFYEEVADHRIETGGKTIDQVAEEVLSFYGNH